MPGVGDCDPEFGGYSKFPSLPLNGIAYLLMAEKEFCCLLVRILGIHARSSVSRFGVEN